MINFLSIALSAFLAPAAPDVPVVTVCEALQNRDALNGKVIVVVGRFSGSSEGSWLSQDCENKIVTDGFIWPNSISLAYIWSSNKPNSMPAYFSWDEPLLRAKLIDVQSTTFLKGGRWQAVYGLLEARVPLTTFRHGGETAGYGFGHLNSAPAQLASPRNGSRVLEGK